MLGIEDIFKNITVQTGQSRGVSAAELRGIWHGVWNSVERLLSQGKSVTVPNFATISVIPNGNTSSLSFQLTSHFTSTHNITSPTDVKGPGTGTSPAVPLHAAFVENELNGSVTRHAVQNSLKDIVRHIGLVAGSGKALRLDCNPVMSLNFLNCRANVAFNSRLARVLPSPARSSSAVQNNNNNTNNNNSSAAAAAGGRQQQQQSNTSSRRESQQPQYQNNNNNDSSNTPRGSSARSSRNGDYQQQQQQQQQQSSSYVPRPPSSQQQHHDDQNEQSQSQSQQQRKVNIQEMIASARGNGGNNQTEAISASRGTFSQASSSARAQNRDQRMAIAREITEGMNVSQHKKHMMKKNIYRHLRGEVYRNIWEQNQMDVSARRQAEAKADRELMEHLDAVAAHERALLEQRERDRRRTAMETRLLNQKLAPLQKSQQLPRVQDPGEIFYQRQNPLVLQKDTQTLMRQMQDRKAREEIEREQDRKLADEAHQEYLKVKQEAADARRKRQEAQVVLRAETERIINEKNRRHQEELDHDRHMARNGGLFFEEGGNVFAERSRHIMRENVQLMRQRAEDSRRERSDALRNQGIEFRNQLVEDAAEAVAHRKHEQENKDAMREAWQKQMAEKNARLRAEKRARDTWRDKWSIQNSSSDDDD